MSEAENAVLALFVVKSSTKWNKSENKKNIQKFIDIPLKYKKYEINSYAILTNRWELKTLQEYSKKYKITIYQQFNNLLNSKTQPQAYFIKHFHVLHQTHILPKDKMPNPWVNVTKSPYNDIFTKILHENRQIRKYQQQYALTFKILSILPEHLTLIQSKQQKFTFAKKLTKIALGDESILKKIFQQHNQKSKILTVSNKIIKFDSKLTKKQKRNICKKNHKSNNTTFINEYIKNANEQTIKQNNDFYLFLFKYANDKWKISWNEFIQCKQYASISTNRFQHLNDKKNVSQLEKIFIEQKTSEYFNKYMAQPKQSVPISIINADCSPTLPIIQFKKTNQTRIKTTIKFQNLTTKTIHYKKCKKQGMYEIMNIMMNQHNNNNNNFDQITNDTTIHHIMTQLIPLKTPSKIYWLKFKTNLTTCEIGINDDFNGILMQALMAKTPITSNTTEKSSRKGLKYFFKLFVHSSIVKQLSDEQMYLIYKLGFDMSQELKKKYNIQLSNWQFGFYYVNKRQFIHQFDKQWDYNGITQNVNIEIYRDYVDYKQQIKPIESIDNFLNDGTKSKKYFDEQSGRFYHGSWRYKHAMTQIIATQTYAKAMQAFDNEPNYWHVERSLTRYKGYAIMNYFWNSKRSAVNKNLSEAEKRQAEKVAGGLRYFLKDPRERKIPTFINSLIPCVKRIGAWDDQYEIGQTAANVYFCEKNSTKPVYAELGPHFEDQKFEFLVGIYINSSDAIKTGCAINLKANVGNGVVLVETEHLDIIRWDS